MSAAIGIACSGDCIMQERTAKSASSLPGGLREISGVMVGCGRWGLSLALGDVDHHSVHDVIVFGVEEIEGSCGCVDNRGNVSAVLRCCQGVKPSVENVVSIMTGNEWKQFFQSRLSA
jgi:hypothetical protein